jgi:uncharacterized iron-regulated membrane protein
LSDHIKRAEQAKTLRVFRKIHRITGAALFVFFFIVALTGLLLGWKKNSNGYLLPNTPKGTSAEFKDWLPIDSLYNAAIFAIKTQNGIDYPIDLDRLDINKEKGVAKFIFDKDYWSVQIDGATAKVLSIDVRRSDFIENIHDGLIIDRLTNNSASLFKLFYTTIMGLALLTFTITGFWLWYGPKRMRKGSN